jgi:hypothetical protein
LHVSLELPDSVLQFLVLAARRCQFPLADLCLRRQLRRAVNALLSRSFKPADILPEVLVICSHFTQFALLLKLLLLDSRILVILGLEKLLILLLRSYVFYV